METKDHSYNHIDEYLNYYLSLGTAPNYAIMLRGKWGSGKSWFIKDYMRRHTNHKYLYVSLYGITNYEDVRELFYNQLHPTLSSKSIKLAGKVVTGFLKEATKVDLSKVNLADYLANLEDRILIFDDLERCSIPIYNILGYINQFVETDNSKVIIIANEEEIIRLDSKISDETKKYLNIKEKIIGKSFDINPDINSSMNSFISIIDNTEVRSFLEEEIDIIKETFLLAGYNNLRHVRQSILDFSRFFSFLSEKAKSKKNLLQHITKIFFAISFEVKVGHIIEDEITSIFYRNLNNEEAKKYRTTLEKYSVFNIRSVPKEKIWKDFFKSGFVDEEEMNESISNSSFFVNENTPNWIKLWNFYHLSDEEFDSIFSVVYNDLMKCEVDNVYQLLHIVGMFLSFSERSFITYKKDEILKMGLKSVDSLKEKDKLKLDRGEEFPSDSSYGLGYQGRDIEEYSVFLDYVDKKIETVQKDDYTKESYIVIEQLEKSFDGFERMFWSNNYVYGFQSKPVFKYIPIDRFITALYNLSNWDKKSLGWFFQKRYVTDADIYESVKEEVCWIKELHSKISVKNINETRKITKFTIENFLQTISGVIDFIEK